MDKSEEINCYCKNVTKGEIENAISNGAKTLKDVQRMTSACTGNLCEELNPKGICCSGDIVAILPKFTKGCSCCCG